MLLKQYFHKRPLLGFTLLELLLATSIGSLIVFVSFSFLRNISSDFSTSRSRQTLQDQSSAALDLIATEVRSSKRISTYLSLKQDSPVISKKCLPITSREYLFSIELPRQATSKDTYTSNLRVQTITLKHSKIGS